MIIDKRVKYFNLLYVISYSLFMLFIYLFYKANVKTDAYFTVLSYIKFLFIASAMSSEMFVQYFRKLHTINKKLLDSFIYTNIIVSFIYGLLIFLVVYVLFSYVINFYFQEIQFKHYLMQYSKIMLFSVSIYPFFALTSNYFIANNKMLLYYISMAIPSMIDLGNLLIFQKIDYLPYSFIVGYLIALIFRLRFINLFKILKTKKIFPKKKLYLIYMKQSFSMKSVNLIPQLVKNIVIFFLLSRIGTGMPTLYTYCTYVAYTIFKIVFEPILQQNLFTITNFYYHKKTNAIRLYLQNIRRKRTLLYVVFSFSIVLFSYIVSTHIDIGFNSTNVIIMLSIQFMFHLFLFYEETFNVILYAGRNVKYYLVKNVVFVLLYIVTYSILYYFNEGYLSVILSLLLSQILIVYTSKFLSAKILSAYIISK